MSESGISIEEACRARAETGSGFLADEDFARQCNSDGSVKPMEEKINMTIKGTDISYSVAPSSLYVSLSFVVLIIAVAIVLVVRKRRKSLHRKVK